MAEITLLSGQCPVEDCHMGAVSLGASTGPIGHDPYIEAELSKQHEQGKHDNYNAKVNQKLKSEE